MFLLPVLVASQAALHKVPARLSAGCGSGGCALRHRGLMAQAPMATCSRAKTRLRGFMQRPGLQESGCGVKCAAGHTSRPSAPKEDCSAVYTQEAIQAASSSSLCLMFTSSVKTQTLGLPVGSEEPAPNHFTSQQTHCSQELCSPNASSGGRALLSGTVHSSQVVDVKIPGIQEMPFIPGVSEEPSGG